MRRRYWGHTLFALTIGRPWISGQGGRKPRWLASWELRLLGLPKAKRLAALDDAAHDRFTISDEE